LVYKRIDIVFSVGMY